MAKTEATFCAVVCSGNAPSFVRQLALSNALSRIGTRKSPAGLRREDAVSVTRLESARRAARACACALPRIPRLPPAGRWAGRWLTHARRPVRARHDVDLHLRRGELSANQSTQHGMYYGDTASTAKTRNFANFSPVALACSYSGECRQRRRCSRLSQRVITTRPFGGSPSIAVPLPAAT